MKIEITKNFQDGNRTRLKGQTLEVTPWKAEELFKRKCAKELHERGEFTDFTVKSGTKEIKVPIIKAETAEKIEVKETR